MKRIISDKELEFYSEELERLLWKEIFKIKNIF